MSESGNGGTSPTDLFVEAIAERVAAKLRPDLLAELRRLAEEAEKPPEYLTPPQAAKLARKSRKAIYDAIYSGELPCIIDGKRCYIKSEDLKEWRERGARKL